MEELDAAVRALIDGAETATDNEIFEAIEACGHHSWRNPAPGTRGTSQHYIAYVSPGRTVTAAGSVEAIKRAFVARGERIVVRGGATTQDGPGPFRPS